MLCIIYYIYWRTLMFANNADLSGFWGCARSNKKERQLNCEVLRIVAMLMIVCLHYFGKGGLLGKPSDPELTAAGYTIWSLEALGSPVNHFSAKTFSDLEAGVFLFGDNWHRCRYNRRAETGYLSNFYVYISDCNRALLVCDFLYYSLSAYAFFRCWICVF